MPDKKKKADKKNIDSSKYIELEPVLESFVDDVIDGSEDYFSSSNDYTYSDLLYAVIDDDYDSFEDMMGGECEDLFDFIASAIEEEGDEMLDEAAVLSIAQRRKRAMTMRRFKGRLAAARNRAKRRKASPEKLKQRARKKARNLLKKRFTQGKDYSTMSAGEKSVIDKKVSRISPAVINRMAQRQLPAVRQAEVKRLSSLNQSVEIEDIDDLVEAVSNLDAIFESKFKDVR